MQFQVSTNRSLVATIWCPYLARPLMLFFPNQEIYYSLHNFCNFSKGPFDAAHDRPVSHRGAYTDPTDDLCTGGWWRRKKKKEKKEEEKCSFLSFAILISVFTMAPTLVWLWSCGHPTGRSLTHWLAFHWTDKNKHVPARPKAGHRHRRWMACSASVVE